MNKLRMIVRAVLSETFADGGHEGRAAADKFAVGMKATDADIEEYITNMESRS